MGRRGAEHGIYLLAVILTVSACRPRVRPAVSPEFPNVRGFFIQAGVFSVEANAAGLTRSLKNRSVPAFYFAHASGFYKVWIGRYASRENAERAARRLRDDGTIREYFVVEGRAFAAPGTTPAGAESRLRGDLVETARSFLDYPYAWGGASAREGFDCSGLAMTVYRLNGLEMPRSLSEQFESGRAVAIDRLGVGDLVFFDTGGNEKVSHVGIYIGDGRFIHAPGTNQTIRADSLSNPYFRMRIIGARTYIGYF
jgi:hypothetical protein